MPIKTSSLSGPELYGYVAEPELPARGGVPILPTPKGVNEFARQHAAALAHALTKPDVGGPGKRLLFLN